MFGLGLPEILLIVLAFGFLFFGGKKITDLAKSLGRVSGEFKKGKKEIEEELRSADEEERLTTQQQVTTNAKE